MSDARSCRVDVNQDWNNKQSRPLRHLEKGKEEGAENIRVWYCSELLTDWTPPTLILAAVTHCKYIWGAFFGFVVQQISCVKQLTIWPTSFINVQHDEAFFPSSSPLLLSLKVHFPLATLTLSTCHPVCLQSTLEICRFKLKIFHISYCSIVVVFREWPQKKRI